LVRVVLRDARHDGQRTGSFWRVDTDASGGLPLLPGKL